MDATGAAFRRFELAYRQPEWMVAPVKFDDRTVAIEALRSFDQVQNPDAKPAFEGIAAPLDAAQALFAQGYADVAERLTAGPSLKEDLL